MIKRRVSLACRESHRHDKLLSCSRRRHRESTLWQRCYWEHQIRDEADFIRHFDYIHYNPVRHGLVTQAVDWPYSSLHRYIDHGVCAPDRGGGADTRMLSTAME